MNLIFFHPTWGLEALPLEARLTKIKEASFDGVEIGVPGNKESVNETERLIDQVGLLAVVQMWTQGTTPAEHVASFEKQYLLALQLKPILINSHTGRDWFSLEDNLAVFDRAAKLEEEYGIPVRHETHRGRALFSVNSTMNLLEARPRLHFTADFSHWCCVHESLLEDQQVSVDRAIGHCDYIHARIGHSQGPQVPDPRDPAWKTAVDAHLAWWQKILIRREQEGHAITAICPEFGPHPYTINLPYTQKPISDLWEINLSMRDLLRAQFGR
jgi:sugar phosphate isomerase/epimerase